MTIPILTSRSSPSFVLGQTSGTSSSEGSSPPSRWTNLAVLVALAASPGATANTDRPVAAEIREYGGSLASGAAFLVSKSPSHVETPDQPVVAQTVRSLYDKAGLTWEQLARLFGVSRRAVHNWANGGKMTARHIEILSELTRVVADLPATTSAERRELLLAPSPSGVSLFDEFRSNTNRGRTAINRSPLAPDQLLGAIREDE